MKTDNIKVLHDAIGEAGKSTGFTKSGSSWYADRRESVLVINPQKSQYGQRYYLNLGVFFRALGTQTTPKEQDCHVRARLAEIVGADRVRTEQLLNFEEFQISEEARRKEFASLLQTKGLPFLEQCSSLDGARLALSQGTLDAMPISKALRELLQSPTK